MEVFLAITSIVALPLSILGGVFVMRTSAQRKYDREGRKVYRLQFPADVPVDRATAELRALPASIKASKRYGAVVPTMVFETINRGGIFDFRVRVPAATAEYVVGQLGAAIPGISVEPVYGQDLSLGVMNGGVEVGMNHPDHAIEISGKPADVAISLLNSFSPVGEEVVVMQWVIAASGAVKLPASDDARVRSTVFSASKALLGKTEASRDELSSRRSKVEHEPNFLASLRIAARSESPERSLSLAHNVVMWVKASDGPRVRFLHREIKRDLTQMVNEAWTPVRPQLQLSVSEYVPRMGWPLGSDYVEGVARSAFRHIMPSPEVLAEGIVLGVSTMPGSERPIAMPSDGFRTHLYIGGKTEVGKTTLGVNLLRQLIAQGLGVIIIERDGDLIHRTLDQLQAHDLDRVINIDVSNESAFVGINPFDFERPSMIATKLADLFASIYEIKSVNVRKLLYHGIPALAETGDATLLDFIPLIDPKTPAEKLWSKKRLEKLKTKELVDFFTDWQSQDEGKRRKDMEPVLNRFWELTLDPQISRMLNNTHSTVDLGKALEENRIICVNLKGVDTNLAELVGSLLVSWIWDLSARHVPERADNVMFLDEAHLFSHLEGTITDMLATARKRRLGLLMATQYVTRMPKAVEEGISTNARTKLIFESGKNEAHVHAGDFASREVDKEMLMNLPKYTAVAKVKLPSGGVSQPLTLRTLDEPRPVGYGHHAIAMSNAKYTRTAEQIAADQRERRHVPTNKKGSAPLMEEPLTRPFDADD
ncbi:type IV secretory system conjugative DNA transfer family protein [Dietzia maris]|uniref:type IV secretory system conjugative DNA transfer family protein n=1 Tax=Dietzia maris TaxID=37915 RepID=UPI0037CB6D91